MFVCLCANMTVITFLPIANFNQFIQFFFIYYVHFYTGFQDSTLVLDIFSFKEVYFHVLVEF